YKDQMPKRNLCRFAKLILPTGGLNAFSAKELREFAAKLIEAADQLDDAETWLVKSEARAGPGMALFQEMNNATDRPSEGATLLLLRSEKNFASRQAGHFL